MTCLVLYMVLRSLNVSKSSLFFAVLLFGLHPTNTESVSWTTSRNNILTTLFALMSFYFYIKKVKDFITWGEIEEKTLAQLLAKWGRKAGDEHLDAKEVQALAKDIVAGSIKTGLLIEVYLVLFLLAGVGIWFCTQWFKRESVIFARQVRQASLSPLV